LDLAVGRTVDELYEILERVPLLDGIRATVDRLHELGIVSALLTHNPTYVCDWYRERFGFDDAEGTEGTVLVERRVTDSGPAKAAKVEGLYRLLRRHRVAAAQVVHVGDGWADAEIFSRVGAGIAINTRFREVERKADAVVRTTTLTDILPLLEQLPARAPLKGA
jgi:phosphoserine phosphatase